MARESESQNAVYHARLSLENGYNKSFNGKLRDELLNGEIFYTLKEAKILTKRWRHHYITIRPHSSVGYRPPDPETILPRPVGLSFTALRSAQQGGHNRQTLTLKADHIIGASHTAKAKLEFPRGCRVLENVVLNRGGN